MAPRLELHNLLKEAVGEGNKVYFQPPSNVLMTYPCIVYERAKADTKFADNNPYRVTKRYKVTLIDEDPDSVIFEKVILLPGCAHSAFFVAGNLNHDVFDIQF